MVCLLGDKKGSRAKLSTKLLPIDVFMSHIFRIHLYLMVALNQKRNLITEWMFWGNINWCRLSSSLYLSSSLFISFSLYFFSLPISLFISLNLSLSLRDRDRADTIITFHHHHHHRKLFKCLLGDLYSSVIHHWNRQLKPYSFPLRKNRVN